MHQLLLYEKMAEWDVVSSFINIPENTPVTENFQEWWGKMWQPIEKACQNVAKHQYVLQHALNSFKENSTDKTWEEAFEKTQEIKCLTLLCQQVGLEPTEFLDFGFEHHRNACRKACSEQL